MKKLFILLSIVLFASTTFATDFLADALAKAKKENKAVMVIFSGLEWCPPCQMFDRYIIKSEQFKNFAKANLVMLEVDTKRTRKTVVSMDGKDFPQNATYIADVDTLQNKYPHRGVPYAVVVKSDGTLVYEQLGCPRASAQEFIDMLKTKIGK